MASAFKALAALQLISGWSERLRVARVPRGRYRQHGGRAQATPQGTAFPSYGEWPPFSQNQS
eukprot:11578610-Alexandrium_andersonii.AAC.1